MQFVLGLSAREALPADPRFRLFATRDLAGHCPGRPTFRQPVLPIL